MQPPKGWNDPFDAPMWVDVRAIYRDGRETVGEYYQSDIENIWWDKQSPGCEDWPVGWLPIEHGRKLPK